MKYANGTYQFDGSIVKALTGVDVGGETKFYTLLDENKAKDVVWDAGTHIVDTTILSKKYNVKLFNSTLERIKNNFR